jgi:hypothetical protein
MANFKPKPKKKIQRHKKYEISVDKQHQKIMNDFSNDTSILSKKNKKLKNCKVKLIKLKSKRNELRLKNDSLLQITDEIIQLEDTIRELKNEIKDIKKRENMYLLNNGKVIFDYFEHKQSISQNNNVKTNVDNFFNLGKKNKKTTSKVQLDTIKYLSSFNNEFFNVDHYQENIENCPKCSCEFIPQNEDGVLICRGCGYQIPYLIEHQKQSYKEPPKEVCFYAYKRINHFREILAQFQGKETTTIDDKVMNDIKAQIKKERLSLNELTNERMKIILKKLSYNKYYEHIPFIKHKMGIKPPVMTIELENTLCNMFAEIQAPYAKHCPVDRVNFLNYYGVLYKLCELLGHDEYLPHFYMLKDPIKRMEQDEIWKKICSELNWEYIPTI